MNWFAVLLSSPPPTPQPPFPPKGGEGRLILDYGFIFVVFTQKCIVDDICDAGRQQGAFFHFPPARSTNKRVGKVYLTFLPNFVLLTRTGFI